MSRCLLPVLFTLIALASGCAQEPVPSATRVPAPPPIPPPATGTASPASPGQNGLILVANVSGKVNQIIDGATTALKVDAAIPAGAKISTGGDASVVLVCSNGATMTLGADSELVL